MVEDSATIRFGVFELDLHTRELRKAGRKVAIQEQPLRVLVTLLERPGELVTRDELREKLWEADTFVDFDTALNKAITKIRDVLADSAASPRFVETLPKRGYRFIAPVHKPTLDGVVEIAEEERAGREPARLGWRTIAAVGVAGLGLIAGGYFYFHRVPKLTDKDTVVLSDFINRTGDPVFDRTLRQGLAIQLEQSPFLKIMDDEAVQQELRLMSLPAGSQLSEKIAHDICVRDGAAATIDGSISSMGRAYVIALEANTCQGGVTLAREQIQAEDKEHVLNAVGKAATAMRAKLGESLSSIQKLNRPLEQVTTPSLEALQNYDAGRDALNQGQFLAAVPLLERATALDPNFAMAYRLLTLASSISGNHSRTCEYTGKAFALMDRVSEFEREFIAGDYYYDCTGELDKAIDAFRLGSRNYPREAGFPVELSSTYTRLGQFEEALKEAREAVRLQANVEPPNIRELMAYLNLDRIGEAKQVAEKARSRGLDGAAFHMRALHIAFIEDDRAGAEREIQWFRGKPEEYYSFSFQAREADSLGRRREARELYRRASETALRRDLAGVASNLSAADALADALTGNCQTARRLGSPAFALALCGDAAQAEKFAVDHSKLFPNGTLWNGVQLPEIRAAIELQAGHPAKAVELLAPAGPFERAYAEVPYLRGLAYLRLEKGGEAAVEFQKILDHKGANWGLYYALSTLGMARVAAVSGDRKKAKAAYENFFALWKGADADIPILRQGQAEYRKLQ
jgi:eukaryotic-like serine/threonine-protein kinase